MRSTWGHWRTGNPNVPAVYRDPEHFFASYLTKGLRRCSRTSCPGSGGGAGNRGPEADDAVRRRQVAHRWHPSHAARSRKALDVIPEGKGLPKPARCELPSSTASSSTPNGKAIPGEEFRARTMWGWIAWSLGGKKGYELLKGAGRGPRRARWLTKSSLSSATSRT